MTSTTILDTSTSSQRSLAWTILVYLCLTTSALAETDLSAARSLLRSGNHDEAAEIYAPSAKTSPEAAIGLARCLSARGKTDEAVDVLKQTPQTPDVAAELASVALDRGDYDEATHQVDAALKRDVRHVQARWIHGELARVTGRLDEAEQDYARLMRYYNSHDVTDAETLRWIGLATARYARWNHQEDQIRFLVEQLYPDALAAEPDYWPAHLEAGRLYLQAFNHQEAARRFDAALVINPHAAEVHAARAAAALVDHKFDQAQSSAARALEIDPDLLAAHRIQAALAWANFDPHGAAKILEEKALPRNPLNATTLGQLAACSTLLDPSREAEAPSRAAVIEADVLGRNEHAGAFFFAAGRWLEERHQFAQATRYYEEAIDRMPRLVGPHAQLGMMALSADDEVRARKSLEAAFQEDPFHVRVRNNLEVLDHLEEMDMMETTHCRLRHDARVDRLLVRLAGPHLDRTYEALVERFDYRPAKPPLFEVFTPARGRSGRQWFSTRMIGLPYTGLVAASTGHFVGMVSPSDPGMARKLNWAEVLTHEMVHVITLQKTDFRCPHWYTEGLAVLCEEKPRPSRWKALLRRREAEETLYNLKTLNFGFTRPESGDDWHLAYCQAETYVEYMLEDRSEDVLRQLLDAYTDGLSTDEAIKRVFAMSLEEFETGYRVFLDKLIVGAGTQTRPEIRDPAELLPLHRDEPKDDDITAELACAYLRRGATDEASTLAREVLAREPTHPLACYVRARLDLAAGRKDEAIKRLESALDRQTPHLLVLNLLAAIHLKEGRYLPAEELYALGARVDSNDLPWRQRLALVHARSGNEAGLTDVLRQLAEAESADFTSRVQLAKRAIKRKDYAAGAKWANQALEIDVKDAEVYRLLAEALTGEHNDKEAVEASKIAVELGGE